MEFFYVAIFFGLVLALLGWLLRLQLQQMRSNYANGTRALQARLLAPDWAFYAEHLQRPVTPEFQAMYQEFALLLSVKELLIRTDSEEILITEFFPLDAQALQDQQAFVPQDILPFGTAAGKDLFLRPGTPSDFAGASSEHIWLHHGASAEQPWQSIFSSVASLHQALRVAADSKTQSGAAQ
jgi:hypothetical protein